jgi:hypothetical protein
LQLCSRPGTNYQIYRELKNLNSPKIHNPVKKWANELNRAISKEEVQIVKTHRKNISGQKGNASQNHIKILPYSC